MNEINQIYHVLLERPCSTIKRDLIKGNLSKKEFLYRSLRELLETIEQEKGIHGPNFSERDSRFYEILDFIHETYPDFSTKPYEDFYERVISKYDKVHTKRVMDERKASIRRAIATQGPKSNHYSDRPVYKFVY